jgi:hypothetical protein
LAEILDEPVDEIFAWLKSARKLEDEIAKQTKAQMKKR